MNRIFHKKITNEIKKYSKHNFQFDNFRLKPDEKDTRIWYFLIENLKDSPFENGQYIGKILLTDQYPIKPPDFIFITPNGRFQTDKKVCTSFTGFHPEAYSSTWNLESLMTGLISFMTDTKDIKGIGSLETSVDEKKRLAKKSIEWNQQNKIFTEYFKKT